jgi:hypothetical protein
MRFRWDIPFMAQALSLPTPNPPATSIAIACHHLGSRSVRHPPRTARLSEAQSSEQQPQIQQFAPPIIRKQRVLSAPCSKSSCVSNRGLTVSSCSQASLSVGAKSLIRPPGTPLLCQALVRGLRSSNRDRESDSKSVDMTVC